MRGLRLITIPALMAVCAVVPAADAWGSSGRPSQETLRQLPALPAAASALRQGAPSTRPATCIGSRRHPGASRRGRGPLSITKRPLCGGGSTCTTTSVSAGYTPFTLSTSINWCYNGSTVSTADPPGGATSHGGNGWYYWSYWEWNTFTRWSYCCQGNSVYTIRKTGRWACVHECGSATYACTYNQIDLYANGTVWRNQGDTVYNC